MFINNEMPGIPMTLSDNLLGNVQWEEYVLLQREREYLISLAFTGFNSFWKPKVEGIKPTFRYNLERHTIGIFLEKDGKEQLIIGKEGLSDAEDAVVNSLYMTLEQRLAKIRLPKETWI
jgi:hypothetical protein